MVALAALAVPAWGSRSAGPGARPEGGAGWRAVPNPNVSVPAEFAQPGPAVSPDPTTQGSYQVLAYPSPVRSVHAVVLRTGKVLLSAGSGNDPNLFNAGSFTATVWDPDSGAMTPLTLPWDMFCSGHATLPDGRVLIAGGTIAYRTSSTPFYGSRQAYVFDPDTQQFTPAPDMAYGRWYPTLVELGNGDVLAVSGLDVNGAKAAVPELYGLGTGTWSRLPARSFANYPQLVLTADGRLFYSGEMTGRSTGVKAGFWSPFTNAYQVVAGLTQTTRRFEGATILLPPAQAQKVMVLGGGFPGITDTNIADLTPTTPRYVKGPALRVGKAYVSAVILPDSTVFETGGGVDREHPVFESATYDPRTNVFTPMATPRVGRTYHSEAVLLPDGRVAVFGGNPKRSFEMRIEVFSPPYLFKGTRPTIDSAPMEVTYGGSYDIAATAEAGQTIGSAVLIRPSAVTHSTDANQRLVALAIQPSAAGVQATVPTNPNVAPPGWYMLFVTDTLGRPSVARWVHLT